MTLCKHCWAEITQIGSSWVDATDGDGCDSESGVHEPDEAFKVEYCGPFVNVYLIDRAYGGPEEGGWWYNVGQIIRSTQYPTEAKAQLARDVEQLWCDEENKQRRSDIGSVLSEGRYIAEIDDQPGADYPSGRPHYE